MFGVLLESIARNSLYFYMVIQFLEGLSLLDFRRDEIIKRKIKQVFATHFHQSNQVSQFTKRKGQWDQEFY